MILTEIKKINNCVIEKTLLMIFTKFSKYLSYTCYLSYFSIYTRLKE